MAEYAGGFGAGFAPGLSQAGGWFSLVPQLREQQARLEEKRSREGLTTLKEALDLPPDVRGPYIDHLVKTLGIDPTLGQMFKRAGEETTADIAETLRVGLEADPVRTARVLQSKNKEMVTYLSTLAKVKRESAQGEKLAGLIGGLSGPATPPGYSFERAETPPAAPPPQAAPMPPMPQGPELLAGPAEEPPTTTGTGALGGMAAPPPGAGPLAPPPARPRPAPISLRPPTDATEALRDVHQRRLDMYGAEMKRLGEFTSAVAQMSGGGIPEAQQRFITSERQRIEAEHKPFLESLGKRLETETAAAAKAKEPLTDIGKTFADLARARAAGKTEEVDALTAKIRGAGAERITEVHLRFRKIMGFPPETATDADWIKFGDREHAREVAKSAAQGREARLAEITIPRPSTGKEIETLASHQSTLGLIKNVEQQFNPDFVGLVRGRVGANVLSKSGQALPGELKFRANLVTYRNETKRLFLGMAQSKQEAESMIEQIPQLGDDPNNFAEKFEATQQNAWRVYNDYYNGLKAGNVDVSRFAPPGRRPPTGAEREALATLRKRP